MDKKQQFKEFVKSHPELIQFTKNGSMTWQKFYEIYDIYGEEASVWDDYFKNENRSSSEVAAAASGIGFADVMNWLKKVDLENVRSGIGNIQKVVGVLQDFTKKDEPSSKKDEYRPRPLYRNFED